MRVKQILIIRHAKSSWAQVGQDDYDRPLNERGQRDAPMMAQRMIDKAVTINAFVASTANRAFTTAGYFAKAYGVSKKDVRGVKKLYHAYPSVFYEVINELEDSIHTVAVFAHNPGITMFVNELTSTKIDDMPTCAIFAVKADIDSWKDFEDGKKSFWFFDYPKL